MEADQPVTGRTISTNCLYTSIESTNWLLDRGYSTVAKLHKKGETEYLLDVLTPKTERFLVQLVILKNRRKTLAWDLTPSKISQKERKMLLIYRPPDHCMVKQLMMIEKNINQVLRFHKRWNI